MKSGYRSPIPHALNLAVGFLDFGFRAAFVLRHSSFANAGYSKEPFLGEASSRKGRKFLPVGLPLFYVRAAGLDFAESRIFSAILLGTCSKLNGSME